LELSGEVSPGGVAGLLPSPLEQLGMETAATMAQNEIRRRTFMESSIAAS
jgi:hypothetical protein